MLDLTREYSEKEIVELVHAVKREEESFKWLLENNCRELAALCDVLVYGNDNALDWLKRNGFMTLLAFVNSLDSDNDAFHFLLKGQHKEWAAVVNVINDDSKAREWLLKFNLKHFLFLADNLTLARSSSGGGMGGFSGGGGGSGFGGFGGGGFGGGGAGGHW